MGLGFESISDTPKAPKEPEAKSTETTVSGPKLENK